LIGKTITVALCLILATCQMPLRSASAQPAGETGWEADCRRGYIRKAFPKSHPDLEVSDDYVRIDILPEGFRDIEKAIRDMRKCEKFHQCIARGQGKLTYSRLRECERRWQ
jgi:hypothetical protein